MLSDNLAAPASVSRDPHPVYAIRIGKVRDGSKTGVLAYAQEHAREWVPPLVTIETAQRLLRNYATHGPTKQLVNNLDIWIVPSVNPDGGHYSFHDFASQRKNMTRYCEPTGNYDVNARTTWGVDNNRNYDQYSLFDGFSGASSSCTSGTYAGPSELSEPENGNVDWIASKPNIKFAMNLHSSGKPWTAARRPLRHRCTHRPASVRVANCSRFPPAPRCTGSRWTPPATSSATTCRTARARTSARASPSSRRSRPRWGVALQRGPPPVIHPPT